MSDMCTGMITKHCIRSVVDNIIKRKFQGYKVKVGSEWYELTLTACEPCESTSDIVDSEVI